MDKFILKTNRSSKKGISDNETVPSQSTCSGNDGNLPSTSFGSVDNIIVPSTSSDISGTLPKPTDKIPLLLNGNYFKIKNVNYDSGHVNATCSTCNKSYHGSIYATSNFLKHLKVKSLLLITYYCAVHCIFIFILDFAYQ